MTLEEEGIQAFVADGGLGFHVMFDYVVTILSLLSTDDALTNFEPEGFCQLSFLPTGTNRAQVND